MRSHDLAGEVIRVAFSEGAAECVQVLDSSIATWTDPLFLAPPDVKTAVLRELRMIRTELAELAGDSLPAPPKEPAQDHPGG